VFGGKKQKGDKGIDNSEVDTEQAEDEKEELEIKEEDLEKIMSWVTTVVNDVPQADEALQHANNEKPLIKLGLNLSFDSGKIDLIERNAYHIKFFQQDLRVGVIMRSNSSFEAIITNKSIGVEIETFKETNNLG
jgi:hypothetical protein